ncbi:MAG: signal peptide peptidase SppA [Bacteroidales bacterium]|nr:signal peptide peptidase SppA [Bacteroidales bacterium]
MKKLIITVLCAAMMLPVFAGDKFLSGKILRIDTGSIAERSGNSINFGLGGLSRSSSISLLDIERAISKAAHDKDIAMIYVNVDNVSASLSGLEEIRECLKKFSRAGKPVVAYVTSPGNTSYYLASAADRIFMYPRSNGSLTGAVSAQMFLKDFLDTLGLDVQLIRHGKFKSAGEMYIRNDISPENRLQYEEMLSSRWNHCVSEMAASRGVSADSINVWTDRLALSSPASWVGKGLVDGLKFRDEMEDYLCRLFGTTDRRKVKFVNIGKYTEKLKKGPSAKKVAVIYADGEISRSGSGIVGEELARTIASVRRDSSVKAVVFRVNSPGGEVVASDMIRREIELLGAVKPVVASYGAYAASGGYLISAGCSHIFTDNTTLTGSIGVFGLVLTYGNALKKHLKINPVVIGTNAHSKIVAPLYPLDGEEEAWYQEEIEEIYDQFVSVVAAGRGMEKSAVDEIAQGRVWTGSDAIKLGLCDETGTLVDAITYAAQQAGIFNYSIATYPRKKDLWKQMLGKEKEDEYLVKIKEMFKPGFNAMARLPYMTINE